MSGGIKSAGDTVPNVKQTRMSRNFARRHAVGFRRAVAMLNKIDRQNVFH